jgi:soluble P-type ATPase
VCEGAKVIGVVELKDVVKGGIKERFAQLRKMGIRTVMITGDNPMTAAAIAAEAGVDDFMAQATPEDKLRRIRAEQAEGHLVAMTGDGTNDAPALAQADVGVAMNTGTQAAREAGNMVDLDSNPTKLIEIVEIGKQLLMTRGALTTFSVANDIAKYFAIIPAMFAGLYALAPGGTGPLAALNLMRLASPESAILSAVIFNALIIVALIPLALRGVAYRAAPADARREHPTTVTLPADLPPLRADFALIEQALANLLHNAAAHTPPGTAITLTAAHDPAARTLAFTIADTGPGLDPAQAARLFDRFARGHPERAGGLGLGLSIVRGFTEAHAGRVTYAPNHPSGATFTLTLPCDPPPRDTGIPACDA